MMYDNVVCIICAMAEEAKACLNVVTQQCHVSFQNGMGKDGQRYAYRYTNIKNNAGEDITLIVTWAPDIGSLETGLFLKTILGEFRPCFVAMTGICAGNKEQVKLGDLVVAKNAYFYEGGKVIRHTDGQQEHLRQQESFAIDRSLLQFLHLFQEWEPLAQTLLPRPHSKQHQQDWLIETLLNPNTPCVADIPLDTLTQHAPEWKKIVREMQEGPDPLLTQEKILRSAVNEKALRFGTTVFPFRDPETPLCHIGTMASGNAVRSDDPFHFINLARKTVAIDMEGAAFYRTLTEFPNTRGLLVKGVSDYADEKKDDGFHPYAASLSALYVLCFIQAYIDTAFIISLPISSKKLVEQPKYLFWHVPSRNHFFTGRKAILEELDARLHKEKPLPQALCGLAGIGKTQIVGEYAHLHQYHYQYTFWLNASTYETLLTDFIALADNLHFPEKDKRVIDVVKYWLECNSGWLLIFDNVNDLELLPPFFPTQGDGHILLTTCQHATLPLAQHIPIKKMDREEGSLFLLQRIDEVAVLHSPDHVAEWEAARAIVHALDGLPLALEQAGGYIEGTMCGLTTYLELYQAALLSDAKGSLGHPDPIRATWSLSFERLRQENTVAVDILYCCSFLSPDEIPEEIFFQPLEDLGLSFQQMAQDRFVFENAIGKLRTFSFIERNKKVLSIHRLVQLVLKESMEEFQKRSWAERAVRIIQHRFPKPEPENWDQCKRYLAHAKQCAELVREHRLFSEAGAQLLYYVSVFLKDLSTYDEATSFCEQALQVAEQTFGKDHAALISYLNERATLYFIQRNLRAAEELSQRALVLCEKWLGFEHQETANVLDNLGVFAYVQIHYTLAEELQLQALTLREKLLDPFHPDAGQSFNNLAVLYHAQDQYTRAEPLYLRAFHIGRKSYPWDHPIVAMRLDSLGHVYFAQHKYQKAKHCFRKALALREAVLGPEHHHMAHSLSSMGKCFQQEKQYERAETYYLRAIALTEKRLGPEHHDTTIRWNELAELYRLQKNYEESKAILRRSFAAQRKSCGANHPHLALTLTIWAQVYQDQQQFQQAEDLYQQAIVIAQKTYEPTHLQVKTIREKYTRLLEEKQASEQWGLVSKRRIHQVTQNTSREGGGQDEAAEHEGIDPGRRQNHRTLAIRMNNFRWTERPPLLD